MQENYAEDPVVIEIMDPITKFPVSVGQLATWAKFHANFNSLGKKRKIK